MKRRGSRIALVMLAITMFLATAGSVSAVTGATTDPDDTTGADVAVVHHADTTTTVTLGFESIEDMADNEVNAQWDLDLDGVAGFEDCITLKVTAGVLRAALANDCGSETFGTVDATRVHTKRVQFQITKADLQGIGLSPAATFYKYRFKNKNASNNTDQVPDVLTDAITHTFGDDPPPPPTGQTATDTQGVGATLPEAGVLSINAVESGVAFGSITPGQSKTTNIGDIDYTNTLGSGLNWSVTVKATSLNSGSNTIPFTNMSFKGGGTIAFVPAAAGTTPTPSTTETAFTGTDTTPGTTYSNPVTASTAAGTVQGSFRQSGSTLKLAVPATGVAAGSYIGTLQYTITG